MADELLRFFYFDLGNVLLTFDYEAACRRISDLAGVGLPQVKEIIFNSDLEIRHERGEITTREFYEAFCERSGARPDYEQMLQVFCNIFELNVPVAPIVGQLRAVGHRLGILSNTSPAHWEFIADGRFTLIRSFFDVHVLSYEVGAMKPEAEIYRAAEELAGEPAQSIFFVDDRAANVAGARDYGFDAVQFTTAAALAADLRERGVRFNY
jgi:putative hydrolase of the HAD superfamily